MTWKAGKGGPERGLPQEGEPPDLLNEVASVSDEEDDEPDEEDDESDEEEGDSGEDSED